MTIKEALRAHPFQSSITCSRLRWDATGRDTGGADGEGLMSTLLTAAQRRSLVSLRIMILACIALPLLLFAYQGYISYVSTFAGADLEIARTRDIAREHAVKVLETIERSLAEVNEIVRGRSDDDIRANERVIHERLRTIDQALPQMKSVWVIDATGRPLATSLSLPAPSSDYSDRDYFAAHIRP